MFSLIPIEGINDWVVNGTDSISKILFAVLCVFVVAMVTPSSYDIKRNLTMPRQEGLHQLEFTVDTLGSDWDLISQKLFIKYFWKVNSPTKSSTEYFN